MDQNTKKNETPAEEAEPVFEVDQRDFAKYWEYCKKRENLLMGILGGAGAAAVSLVVWALLIKVTGYKLGWMGIVEGAAVGFAVKRLGKGISPLFGIIGGAIAFLTWLAGNFITAGLIFSHIKNVGFLTLMSHLDFSMITVFLKAVVGPVDYLLGAAAVYIAYYIGFKTITPGSIK